MLINIKGKNNSLVFVFSPGTIKEFREFLQERIDKTPQIFKGSQVIFSGIGLNGLTHEELAELQLMCLNNGMILKNDENENKSSEKSSNHEHLIYYRNIRSGQKISAPGSVIIWGDVHESAEISAGGDIIVLGRLGGIAHAGCYGDMNSIVFALHLNPTQIRIANRISRASEDSSKRNFPEIAYFDQDNICISAYDNKNSKIWR